MAFAFFIMKYLSSTGDSPYNQGYFPLARCQKGIKSGSEKGTANRFAGNCVGKTHEVLGSMDQGALKLRFFISDCVKRYRRRNVDQGHNEMKNRRVYYYREL